MLLACTVLAGRAQTVSAPAEQTAPTVEELSAEIDALKKRASGWDKVLAALPKFSGYVQAGYEWGDDKTSSFYLRRVRLSLSGDVIRGKVDYRVQFEFTKPQLVDAYVQYKPFTQLNLKLGQYKIPFSIENTDYTPLKLEFIDYPLGLQKLMGFSENIGGADYKNTGRGVGATLWGGFFKREGYSILNYDFGVFNGHKLNSKDDNKSKDIVARVMLRPVDGLKIAGSYYWGEAGKEYLKRIRYSAGACYDKGSLLLRGEWIGGETGIAGTAGKGSIKSSGWYVMGGWHITKQWMPVARYDTLLADTSNSASRQTNYTLGVRWKPAKFLHLHLNYTYEDYKVSAAENRNVISAMVTASF